VVDNTASKTNLAVIDNRNSKSRRYQYSTQRGVNCGKVFLCFNRVCRP